jgi:hypothetical protein
MISCLSLVRESHVRMRRDGGASVTACGLSIAEEHVGEGMFAAEAAAATCRICRQSTAAASRDSKAGPMP